MKKRALRLSVLALLLAITVALSTSCSLFSSFMEETCTHENIEAGDCKNPGVCSDCGKPVGKLGSHVYVNNVVDPGCTEGGYTEHVCSVCGDSYRDTLTSAVGHDFTEWVFTKQPTVTEAGEAYRECSVCGERETDTVPPHEHTLADGEAQEVTCTTDGWAAYEYCTQCLYTTKIVIKATGHAWNSYTSNGDSTHTAICENDNSHKLTEPCSGGTVSGSSLPVCEYCHSEYEFAARSGNSTYGYYALGTYATYGEGMQLLYKDLTLVCEEFLVNNEDLSLDGSHYIIGEFELEKYGITLDAACAVWKVFYVSSPVYYWLDAMIVTRGDAIVLTVAEDYAKAADRRAADAAIAEMTAECNALIKDGMTDLEKAMEITAYIVSNMEYAYESDGTTPVDDMWAHCMAGLAMHGYGVCEAYAKSFMYLCLLNSIDCVMGSGFAGEPHAWNYVKLGNEWYGADITWTDNSGDMAVYDYFGLSGTSIFKNHTPHSSSVLGSDFIYEAPELSENDIILTALYKNGEYVGMYKSLDEAFAAMTDENGEYTVDLGFYSFYEGAPVHTIKSAATPNVKKLTIVGRNEPTEPGYLDNNSLVYLSGALTLGSDVVLQNVYIMSSDGVDSCSLNLAGNTLTLDGKSVYVTVKIRGTEPTSVVVASTDELTGLNGGVDIYKLVIENDGVVFGADSKLVYCPRNGLYTSGNPEIEIEHYT